MGYGMGGGIVTGGLGSGALITVLPNTGGSLRVMAVLAIVSTTAGLVIVATGLARFMAIRRYGS